MKSMKWDIDMVVGLYGAACVNQTRSLVSGGSANQTKGVVFRESLNR